MPADPTAIVPTADGASTGPAPAGLCHLRAGGVSLVLDWSDGRLPQVHHWGADLGELSEDELRDLARASVLPIVTGQLDAVVPLSLVPEQSAGWMGTPGLTGHRAGADFTTAFTVRSAHHEQPAGDPVVVHRLRLEAADDDAELALVLHVEMLVSGLVRLRGEVTSTGAGVFDLAGLDLALPVPTEADEVLDLTGRHLRERAQQRHAFTLGTHLRESRRGRGHDASLVVAAGAQGFGWRSGEVRAVHLAWSGNTRTYAERTNHGASMLAAGELLLAGEVRLAQGETYEGPWVYGSVGDGLDAMAARFHTYLRARPEHPRSARPVLINVWEAVYFDHDLGRLIELADRAAALGVERYVLDDGWFGSRRDATSGLGDWEVSAEVWPEGLGPIVDHVHGLGMQFGLWFEPEMINPDSDLARAHPDWILAPPSRLPVPARDQQVLDLTHPGAYAHVRDQMLAVLAAHRIDYIKWDHNRDLVEAAHQPTGQARVHEQTLAAYRLMDEIRAAHPALEIESCAGGGGRVDLGVVARTDRVWTSDCIDPLERQLIEAGAHLLLPPELLGSHIASPISHTTGRAHALDYRAGTAFFSHLGIEWDITRAEEQDLARLATWVAAHQEHRALLHSGVVVHSDQPDPALWLHGVVAQDGSAAIFTFTTLATPVAAPPGRLRLPGLDPEARYHLRPLPPGDVTGGRTSQGAVAWWADGVTLPGRVLAEVGLQMPALNPEQMVLLHAARV
ncbi:alpha-galactosidase [Actinotalea sp. C106]|uniref:alpha-galactosidase n=1 Tax=Actinotalea sp. C106 TaxID=2908644 RepID=UPI0020295E82|nr:alpha-galactosidase [Actinotalea sp. C106]